MTPTSDGKKRGQGLVEILQMLSGIASILLIPLVWAAWSTDVMYYVLGAIFSSSLVFVALSYLLHRMDAEAH